MAILSKLKKPTNLTIDAALLAEARELGVKLSQSAGEWLREAERQAKSETWKKENAEALQSWNDWVKKNGIPLEKYRRFKCDRI